MVIGRSDFMNFILPKPVSVNSMYTNSRWTGQRVRTKKYDQWREAAGRAMREQGPVYKVGLCSVQIHLYTCRTQDVDGIIKPVLDLLTHMGVYDDDSQVQQLLVSKHKVDHVKDQQVEVIISPVTIV